MSEYQRLLEEKFGKDDFTEQEENRFLFMYYAPADYGVEDMFLKLIEENPDITFEDLEKYFDENVPAGLATNDDGADLLD